LIDSHVLNHAVLAKPANQINTHDGLSLEKTEEAEISQFCLSLSLSPLSYGCHTGCS